ncbi:dachsous cadherin-related 1 isoform X2 [Leptinotarsa decemlineata]|uniref:dachsous cadherin-related 1 isoform X2 n=1 Tax=Leptinotarsa decemlineata TaxID=7539 RepID=UPI003D30D323
MNNEGNVRVSATDPDCGVNAVVNYTLGDGSGKVKEFKVRSDTGEICISSSLDYETRNVYEFPVIATDRGGLSTTAMLKIQITDVNDNRPIFYPPEYYVSLRERGSSSSATTPIVVVAATDADSGKFGTVTYKIVAGNEAGLFRIERATGEIFLSRPNLLSARIQPYQRLNISAVDGGNLKSLKDAEVFISVIDSAQRPPIFEHSRYTYSVSENVRRGTSVGNVKATVFDNAGRGTIRYYINSGDPDGYFRIDPITGAIITSSSLDHESKSSVLLNIQATSGEPPVYGHTQVNIEIEDVNDNAPEFESSTVRISVPENVEIGLPLYSAHAIDKDSDKNGVVRYKIANNAYGGLFKVDAKLGDLTITRHLDYETTQRHTLVITATDMGIPALSANLTVFVEVQDVNDNPPVFERNEYSLSVLESLPANTQILQLTAVDADTGNNARITYRLLSSNVSDDSDNQEIFGIFPNSGWLYLRGNLDREAKDKYVLVVAATDNGTPSETATTRVLVDILDANDNDPAFVKEFYEFSIEENLRRGTSVGKVLATDADIGENAAIRYSLIPSNSSFQINEITGDITTKDVLDRETKQHHDLVVEARDKGSPPRSSRVVVKIVVLDVNDNTPEIVDPQEDVISVREEQPPGTEVVRVRAIDADNGNNASLTYSIVKNHDSDGHGVFAIDPVSGVIKTRMVLDHEEKTIYRLAVAVTDGGKPPKQSIRMLRVEVLDLNDNRPTFTSSSLAFRVDEDVPVGYVVGSIALTEPVDENSLTGSGGYVTYSLTSLSTDTIGDAFDIDRSTGSLVVARRLDRETQSEYRLEVRALDTSAMNNPQSSAVTVRVDIADVNDNAPKWPQDPITIPINEHTEIGTPVFNFSAFDADSGSNSQLRYSLQKQHHTADIFSVDLLTGTLVLLSNLDFETTQEYTIIVTATDQSQNVSERLSTSVTGRIIVTDFNDNAPKFVVPTTSTVQISESTSVGMTIAHIIAIDMDSGDNGRVTYIISNGNDAGLFSLGYDTGTLTLAKPLPSSHKSFVLNITANDHGTPTKQATMQLKLVVQGSLNSSLKFLESQYLVSVPEDVSVGSVVTKVSARSGITNDNNITFIIPPAMAHSTFEILSPSGEVLTKKPLDREEVEAYVIPIYVSDWTHSMTLFDSTTLVIKVTDVNDNTPKFQPGSCYRLSVPENSETAVIHTVTAEDLDEGPNGDVSYSITSGNNGNKFSVDPKSGDITSRPLDRESQSRYSLTITARDRGTPTLQSSCNLSIYVEDQNDNDPKFDLSKYSTAILEDVPIDTSVLTVHASDADLGVNARIIYSLANESHWLFRVDNKTGLITTAGLFDRERHNLYNFLVVATDSGKYNARSQSVPVTVKIMDVNDNNPVFIEYPFKEKVTPYIQPGQMILKVSANDVDEGTNAEIVYSILNDNSYGKFRINPNTGILTTTQSLASNKGKVSYLNILATDKGNPPRSSTGLIEIMVGDLQEGSPLLKFQNDTYTITVSESAEQFQDIIQVAAVRTDGRRQKIIYSIGSGNEENIFVINSSSGIIQVRDPKNLDYELHKEIVLVVEARTEGNPNLHGYCNVIIQITDENDNSPKFTQQQYSASVWEGNKKGAFVLQVVAFDADEGSNSRILYHIVDGNHDNAFKIEPAFSGTLKTNIVLDREIRDLYRLTVIATDEGIPQMTGTARIRINVVDVNDNQPTFPPHSIITVKEDTPVGTVLTIVTANDVDTYPPLTYAFAEKSDVDDLKYFSIDRYSGKVVLKKSLDFELWQECKLEIVASDTAHVAHTTLTIKVLDVNDNAPVFLQASYVASLPDGNSASLVDIVTLNATDPDTEENGKIRYSIVNITPGFVIGEDDGILRTNLSTVLSHTEDILLTVKATDMGDPLLHSFVPVRIRTNVGSGSGQKSVNKLDYKINIPENTTRGFTIIHLAKPPQHNEVTFFRIVDGNDDGLFEISNPSGAVILVKPLDRELQEIHNLKISADESNLVIMHVRVNVDDSNDNAPIFQSTDNEKTVSENLAVGSKVDTIISTDADQPNSPNSEVVYDITSGNDEGSFRIDSKTGVIYVNKSLDYDQGKTEYNLIIRACDKGTPVLCTLNTFLIILQDENDNEPKFPVAEYLEFVGENEPIGTVIFTAHATDLDRGFFGAVNYSIVGSNNYAQLDTSWKLFRIDSSTGMVTTAIGFDYEQRSRYNFMIQATDVGGKYSLVRVRVEIEGKDEFYPQFTERSYKFTLPISSALPAGYVVGHVTATDRDKGPDGRVVYQLNTQHSIFKVNRTTGDIMIKKKFDYSELPTPGREMSLVIIASSGRQGSLTNTTVVEIILDPLADPGTNLAINRENSTTVSATNGGIADWALGLLIALLLLIITFGAVFVFLHMRNKRNRKINKPNLSSETVSTSNNYVDPSAFDTIPIRAGVGAIQGGNNQFAPPKYDEIPPYGAGHPASSNSGAATTSELSGSEQSGSSGRGSAEEGEDGEDEEIRMINEGPLQRDSGIHRQNDDDNLSDVSVRNTQEYLARLGIINNSNSSHPQTASRLCADPRAGTSKENIHHHQSVPLDNLHIFDEEGNENDITNMIYAKLNDVAGSDRGSSTNEGGATNLASTMDHVMGMGGYGDVPTVTHQPSMNGSLSSIVHSEEELAGSYNWDYLLDWGPQYQPLAHVFSEIARLKDDTASVHSGASGTSSVRSKNSAALAKNIPPPLITSVAPRSIAMPLLSSRGVSSHHNVGHNQMMMLPRSPINHDASGATFSTSTAMSPSFSPSLSPLATKSPSVSPLVAPGLPTSHHVMTRQSAQRNKSVVDTELRI